MSKFFFSAVIGAALALVGCAQEKGRSAENGAASPATNVGTVPSGVGNGAGATSAATSGIGHPGH